MLKRFIVENFLSYKDENILDLTAGRTESHRNHTVNYSNPKVRILKSAIIYGANASGKSNLIKAMEYAKSIIVEDLEEVSTNKKYFRLSNSTIKKPTQFEFEIEIDNRFFSYGFSSVLNTKTISEEWLFEIGRGSPKRVFERKEDKIELGEILKNRHVDSIRNIFETYAFGMKNKSNKLFLSELSDLEIEEVTVLNDIYNWFDKKLIILYPDTQFGNISSLGADNDLYRIFKKYLNRFDTGIVDISSIEENFEESFKKFPNELKIEIEKDLSGENRDKKIILRGTNGMFLTIYKDEEDELKVQKLGLIHDNEIKDIFELQDESDGTKRLFDLIPLITKFKEDYSVIIDEFDRSLHPKLTKAFFELFYNFNDSKSQLIVSTHESTLLDLELVRRDEIWFVEKGKNGASELFSLNQFKERYDKKIEKAYLFGRYGAVPIFKLFDEIEL
jgi:AAA15 family ATPase/GTPase